MILYRYGGTQVPFPKNITHAIVDENVSTIREEAFENCIFLVSLIMHDNVKTIERAAFRNCTALHFVRLSKTLDRIGRYAFSCCTSLENLVVPSTLTHLGREAFYLCESLHFLMLPQDLDLVAHTCKDFDKTGIYKKIAFRMNIRYTYKNFSFRSPMRGQKVATQRSNERVNRWLTSYMETYSFHKLCYDQSITTIKINDFLAERVNAASVVDHYHIMTPLHVLAGNPHAPSGSISALYHSHPESVFHLDILYNTPLDLAREYNVDGLLELINCLCIHRDNSK